MADELDKLRRFLQACPAGRIEDTAEAKRLLKACWEQIEGSDSEAMVAYKLDRMEDPSWEPPILSFTIERHGGTAMGSSRAELQAWTIDLANARACGDKSGRYRQLHPRQPGLKVGPLADELVSKNLARAEDSRLKWLAQDSVRIEIGRVIPASSASQQTLAGRRRRLKNALRERLETRGWREMTDRRNTFQKGDEQLLKK